MSRWRALVLGLIAMLFAVSGIARAAPPPGAPAPCHAMAQMADQPAAPHAPENAPRHHPDMLAMNCCLGCLPSPAPSGLLAGPAIRPVRVAIEIRTARLEGLSLAPELGPPRIASS